MATEPAAQVDDRWEDIDTPALIVNLDEFETNLQAMAKFADHHGVRLRPHAKAHKCPAIALQQIALGAVGVCCQKVSEAEVMVESGVSDILVTNQIIGRAKLDRLAALAKKADIAVCADDVGNIVEIDAAAARCGATIKVLVEIDVGSGRCGVQPGDPAVALARAIAASRNLEFVGLQAYHGRAQHQRSFEDRRRTIQEAADLTKQTVKLLASHGMHCDTIGGGGTGTYNFEAMSGVYNELQVGSYVFMDRDYALNLDSDGAPISEFQHSLLIKSGVLSTPDPDRCVLDAGLKTFSTDSGYPAIWGIDGVEILGVADEHTNLGFSDPAQRPSLGDTLCLVPGHCDPTVNLHDWLIGVRSGRVETVWPVAARGALL